MADFLYHEPCPPCVAAGRDKTGNNLGVWDDGHKWCFACRYYVPGSKWEQVKQLKNENKNNRRDYRGVSLPDDFNYSIPPNAIRWLKKYGLTDKEIRSHGIGWSEDGILLVNRQVEIKPLLILPFYDEDKNLLLYQGRDFGESGTKYVTKGQREDVLPIIGLDKSSDFVVVCEDIVSAYKIGRQFPAMPLLGASLSTPKALRLAKLFTKLVIWLDFDKTIESWEHAGELSPYFKSVRSVVSELDPKTYSDEEIARWLGR